MGVVLVVVLNYQTPDLCIQCVQSVLAQEYNDIRIVVVDNDSMDGSFECLRLRFADSENIMVIQSENNCGYARGNNIGIHAGLERWPCDYIMTLNPDVRLVSRNLLQCLSEVLRTDQNLAGVQPLIRLPSGLSQGPFPKPNLWKEVLSRVFLIYPIVRVWQLLRINKPSKEKPGHCYRITGACFMMRVNDMLDIGCYDEKTFLYYEENILAEKMLTKGKHFYYYPKVVACHDHPFYLERSPITTKANMESMAYYYGHYLRAPNWLIRVNVGLFWIETAFSNTLGRVLGIISCL